MKKSYIFILLLGILLQISMANALITNGTITNPTAGSDISANTNITWTPSTAGNSTSYINYYNVSILNSTNSEVARLTPTNYSTTTLTNINKLVNNITVDFSACRLTGDAYNVKETFNYYDNTTSEVDYSWSGGSPCSPGSYTYTNPNPTKRVVSITESQTPPFGWTVTTSGHLVKGLDLGNQTSRYWDVTATESLAIPVGDVILQLTTYDNFGSHQNNMSLNYTKNAKRLTTNFINEATGTTVPGNVNIDFISDTFTTSKSTTSGSITIVLQPETYTIRYGAAGFVTRFYYITFSNNSDITLNLYMINTSAVSNITFTIIDELADVVAGAYVKALKYDIASNSYILQEIGETNTNGVTTLHLTKNNEFYKFMIELNGVLYLTTVPAYITADTYTLQIITSEDFTGKLIEYDGATKELDFLNNTNQFRLTYTFSNGVSNQVCLYIIEIGTLGYHNQSCTTSNSATMLLGITPTAGKTYSATAFYYPSGVKNFLIAESVSFPKSGVGFGRFGLLIQILLTTLAAFAIMIDLSVVCIAVPGSLMIGYFFGLTTLGLAPIVALTVVGLILAIMVGKRGA